MLAVDWESTVLPKLRLFASIIPELVLQSLFSQRIKRSLLIPIALANLHPLSRYRPHLLHKPSAPAWLPHALLTAVCAAFLHGLLSPTLQTLPSHLVLWLNLNLLHVLKGHTSQPRVTPSLECSHSVFSERTCVPASSAGSLWCGH